MLPLYSPLDYLNQNIPQHLTRTESAELLHNMLGVIEPLFFICKTRCSAAVHHIRF